MICRRRNRISIALLTSHRGCDLFTALQSFRREEGGNRPMETPSNIIQTRMIDLTEISLCELTDPGSSIVEQAAEAVVRETTSPLLVSVAGHSS
jgi:hypothetical protein